MERRDFVKVAAGAAVAAAAGNAFADKHKDHEMKTVTIDNSGFKAAHLKKVAAEASDCVSAAQVCLAHCAREFAAGHTMMAKCQAIVSQTIDVCRALETIATMDSLPKAEMTAFVKSCSAICELCEAECKKHKAKECKDCAKACRACIKACDKLIA